MNSRIRHPLYISLKSWSCCCSLPTVAPQQLQNTLWQKHPLAKNKPWKKLSTTLPHTKKKNHFVVKRERTSPPAEWNQLWWRQLGGTGTQKLPYWNWISRVVNFAILTREYFAEFYFYDFNRQMWKKDNKICDLTILNFILFFQKSEP